MFRYILYGSAALIAGGVLVFLFRKNQSYASDAQTLSRGQKLFTTHCVSCHAMEEDGIGPRLGGITDELSDQALKTFIKNPAKAIGSGNGRATALLAMYKQIMPSYDWMDDDSIHSILSFINYQTKHYKIEPLTVHHRQPIAEASSGRLVPAVKKSGLKIHLEDYIQIPRLTYSTPDLGIVTMRPHPSGDGRLFVSDQGGILYQIKDGKADVFLDMRAHVSDFSIGPGLATGLGSFDFHPAFLENGLLYITHAEKYSGQTADYRVADSVAAEVQWVLAEWKVENINDSVFKGTRRELLRLHAPTFGHGAQDIGFIPGLPKEHPDYGLLYFGFGDGGSNNIRRPELGHDLKSFLGTIMRIDPRGTNSTNGRYGIPDDNPFFNEHDPATLREIWAYGFRNPHRFAWDPSNGYRMMVTDIGESNIEELNIVEKGGDYGWPNREGDFGIAPKKDLKTVFRLRPADRDLYKRPFAQYDHMDGNAISGGYVYGGPLDPLQNKYLFGDIVTGKLFYVNIDRALTDSTIYEIGILQNGKETSLREMSGQKRMHLRIGYDHLSGELYVITKVDGRIKRIVKAQW